MGVLFIVWTRGEGGREREMGVEGRGREGKESSFGSSPRKASLIPSGPSRESVVLSSS